ncbi:MAG TPA: hypothetical protein DSN98_08540 [Thermoplasmata archaeon]|nr:MAG TPA: hypothetical protein DSN98_08540 [Thermoplasmata archaeon]
MWGNTRSNKIVIENTVKDTHFGETYGIIKIGVPVTNDLYGYLNYSTLKGVVDQTVLPPKYGNIFRVHMIRVFSKYQRRGYATSMMTYVKKNYKGYKIDLNTITPEGSHFFKALGIRHAKMPPQSVPVSVVRSNKLY